MPPGIRAYTAPPHPSAASFIPGSPARCPRATWDWSPLKERLTPLALWGDPAADATTWKNHNPYDVAPELTHIPLFISAGNGDPGPLDESGTAPDSIEPTINAENKKFVQRLRQVGANVTADLYGDGTHNWVYWQRELHRAWPILTDKLQSA